MEDLPNHLCTAFDQACASQSPAPTKPYVAEKKEVLYGLGLQILNLGLWSSGTPPLSRLLSGIEPVNALNVEAAGDSAL